MSEIDPIQYGAIIAKVEMMEKKIDGMEADLKSLLELANKSRGGFWVGMAITSSISGLIGYITHLFLSR
jgi:hypothetical protein